MKKTLAVMIATMAIAAALAGCGGNRDTFPISPKNTSIALRNVPANARVYIDNVLKAPGQSLFSVEPGNHTVRIQLMGYSQQSPDPAGNIVVPKGQTVSVNVQLQRMTPPQLPAVN